MKADAVVFVIAERLVSVAEVDVYFGHTHQPFRDHEHDGVRFHNTGSGILDLGFQPLSFRVPSKAA